MDKKTLMEMRNEGGARRRRSVATINQPKQQQKQQQHQLRHQQQQQQQQQQQHVLPKGARQERATFSGKIKSSTKPSQAKQQLKLRSTRAVAGSGAASGSGAVAVVPPARQWQSNTNSNSYSNRNNINKPLPRYPFAREITPRRLPHKMPPPVLSRVAFGSISSAQIVSTPKPRPMPMQMPIKMPIKMPMPIPIKMPMPMPKSMPMPMSMPTTQRSLRESKSQTLKPKTGMAAAHEQLELMLTRFEQSSDAGDVTTPTPTPTIATRRKPMPAKMARHQMEHPPPVPTGSPLSSSRTTAVSEYDHLQIFNMRTSSLTSHPATQRRSKNKMRANRAAAGVTKGASAAATATGANAKAAGATAVATGASAVATGANAAATGATGAAMGATANDERTVPLAQNPQLLPPESRLALLELLSRSDLNDPDIVNVLRNELNAAADPSKDAMRVTLQMLPLALSPDNSPYSDYFWASHNYLKERQKLQQSLKPNDVVNQELKMLRGSNGRTSGSQTLEDELKEEKQVLDYVDAELQRVAFAAMTPEQQARQQQAMDERLELDRQKNLIGECREKHRIKALHRENKRLTKRSKQMPMNKQEIITKHRNRIPLRKRINVIILDDAVKPVVKGNKNRGAANQKSAATKELEYDQKDDNVAVASLLKQRQQFKELCKSSSLYNNSICSEPWKLFANISNKLSAELLDNPELNLHRSVASYRKDFKNPS